MVYSVTGTLISCFHYYFELAHALCIYSSGICDKTTLGQVQLTDRETEFLQIRRTRALEGPVHAGGMSHSLVDLKIRGCLIEFTP